MSPPIGLDVLKKKQNAISYWLEDPKRNWPVKVMSKRGSGRGATSGRVLMVSGCVVSAKFILNRPLAVIERTLGLLPGELTQGAVLLRLNRLPQPNEFDLAAGYTNVPAYPGYPPGLGANQWILTVGVFATSLKNAKPRELFEPELMR